MKVPTECPSLDTMITALEDAQRKIRLELTPLTLVCHSVAVSNSMLDISKKNKTINLSKIIDLANI